MDEFLRFTVTGVTVASIYAIAASGLVVTYTTSGIFNFAHGAFGMMAALTYWQFNTQWGFGVISSFIIVIESGLQPSGPCLGPRRPDVLL